MLRIISGTWSDYGMKLLVLGQFLYHTNHTKMVLNCHFSKPSSLEYAAYFMSSGLYRTHCNSKNLQSNCRILRFAHRGRSICQIKATGSQLSRLFLKVHRIRSKWLGLIHILMLFFITTSWYIVYFISV